MVDEDMAFDLMEMIADRRVTLLLIRADLREEGMSDAADHLTRRLGRLRRVTKRLERLCEEKDWGEMPQIPQDESEEA